MRLRTIRTLALAAPLALGAPLAPAAAQSAKKAAKPAALVKANAAAVAQQLGTLYQRFLDLNRTKDTAGYRDLLTDDYVYVGGDSGTVLDRTERLRRDATAAEQLEVFRVHHCDLRIHDAVAFGPCWYRIEGLSAGNSGLERGRWDGVSLVTFLRGDDGRWRIAATRPSVSAAPPAPRAASR